MTKAELIASVHDKIGGDITKKATGDAVQADGPWGSDVEAQPEGEAVVVGLGPIPVRVEPGRRSWAPSP